MNEMLWWHIYAGQLRGGVFLVGVAGPSQYAVPDDESLLQGDVRWVQTLNREPTEADVERHTPEEYRK